jgi:hypothetical protein
VGRRCDGWQEWQAVLRPGSANDAAPSGQDCHDALDEHEPCCCQQGHSPSFSPVVEGTESRGSGCSDGVAKGLCHPGKGGCLIVVNCSQAEHSQSNDESGAAPQCAYEAPEK